MIFAFNLFFVQPNITLELIDLALIFVGYFPQFYFNPFLYFEFILFPFGCDITEPLFLQIIESDPELLVLGAEFFFVGLGLRERFPARAQFIQ